MYTILYPDKLYKLNVLRTLNTLMICHSFIFDKSIQEWQGLYTWELAGFIFTSIHCFMIHYLGQDIPTLNSFRTTERDLKYIFS